VWNVGTCRLNVKGEIQVSDPHKNESTDVRHRGGTTRSSDEALEREWSEGVVLFGRRSKYQPERGGMR
jgi:hypothetical protein